MRIMKLAKYRLKAQVEKNEGPNGEGQSPEWILITNTKHFLKTVCQVAFVHLQIAFHITKKIVKNKKYVANTT